MQTTLEFNVCTVFVHALMNAHTHHTCALAHTNAHTQTQSLAHTHAHHTYVHTVPMDLDVKMKAVMVGAVFLIVCFVTVESDAGLCMLQLPSYNVFHPMLYTTLMCLDNTCHIYPFSRTGFHVL